MLVAYRHHAPIRQQRRVGRLTLVHAMFYLEYEVARHGNGVSTR